MLSGLSSGLTKSKDTPDGTESIRHHLDGIPFVGPIPDLKKDDSEAKQPQLFSTAFVRQFDLTKDEHLEEYTAIAQKVTEGYAEISFDERIYDNDIKSWRVLIRWMEYKYVNPKERKIDGQTS